MDNLLNVAVLGSTGYVGMELVRILDNHPNVKINFLGSDSIFNKHLETLNENKNFTNLPLLKNNNEFDCTKSDLVFLALPHGISNKYVKKFYGKIKIIDLSADFRLDNLSSYIPDYGENHSCPEYMNEFTYGLAEINKEKIINSNYISIPGCYPTSILLPLIPLFQKNILNTKNIIIDSKSGYSGAGKKFDISNIKKNNEFNFYNYNTNTHRHINEIKNELIKHALSEVSFSFNPHVLPNFRGMMSTIYCELNDKNNVNDIIEVFNDFDCNNSFIKFLKEEKNDFFSVQNTNYCLLKIFKHTDKNKIIIVSTIDNLIKGAAGQAVQCLNISLNINEKTSLI